jgi:Sensors of blue-light using FAD
MLTRLVYCSTVRDLGPGGADALLVQAREKNRKAFLSGVLLFDCNSFLQYIEGDRDQVSSTFITIARDPRHTNLTLISVGSIDERSFPDWTMGYVSGTPALKAVLRQYSPRDDFNPLSLTASAASTLAGRLRDMGCTV